MKIIPKKNIIIIGSILAIVVASCGYGIISNRMSGQLNFQKGNIYQNPDKGIINEKESITETDTKDKPKEIAVHVIGRVKKPGLVKIPGDGRIAEAIEAAGGIQDDADLDIVNLAYKLQDGNQVYIPSIGERVSQVKEEGNGSKDKATSSKGNSNKGVTQQIKKPIPGVQAEIQPPVKIISDSSSAVEAKEGKTDGKTDVININTADISELDKLPGIGPATAQKIIEYREKSGKFKTPEDIMKVKGIGKSKYENIKDKITV